MNNLEQILINETQYSGNTEPNIKQISASQFGDEMLQIWLRYKYGVPKRNKFDQSTIGSIMHKGIEIILSKYDDFETEVDVEYEFVNGWKLSGSIDIVDVENKIIYDVKVTKQYTIEQLKKEPEHHYIWQLSVYRYLMNKLMNTDYNIKLLAILKDGTDFDSRTGTARDHISIIDLEPKSYEEVERRFYEITSEINKFEITDSYPEKCENLWFRKIKGNLIPMKCEIYCSYKDVCPYYVNTRKMSNINF